MGDARDTAAPARPAAEARTSWTVRSLLGWAKDWLTRRGVENPRLDAELLLARALGCARIRLYTDFDKPVSAEELARFKPLITRRGEREPVAYILSSKEFYGRPFKVGPGVFIPRPETELLVQLALEALPEGPARALDLCAGSGAVGVSLACERKELEVDLVELSPEAAAVAEENAAALAPGRARVLRGDLFAPLSPGARYAAIVSNPPYIPRGEEGTLARDITAFEPPLALYGGADGLEVIRRLVSGLRDWLAPGGFFGLELDPPQAAAAQALCTSAGLTAVRVVRDVAGLERLVTGRG